MSTAFTQLLATGPVVTDGAWGTELQAHGLALGEMPDAWNLSHPEQVTTVARAYADAGSRVILTNTFGANRLRLAPHGLAHEVAAINRHGVALSRKAAGERCAVFASIGPTGKLIAAGETTEAELHEVFSEQVAALAEGNPDALVIETMADLVEAKAALAAAQATGLPVVACMVFDAGKEKDRTMMGATPEQAARELTEAGADAIGANCGVGIERYVPVCQRLHAATSLPIWIKPNAGLPTIEEGKVVYHTTPEAFAEQVPELVQAGARFIGGCCGTNPEFIRAMKLRIAAATS